MNMKRQLIIGLTISLACMAYVMRELDFGELWRLAKGVNPLYYLAVMALMALSFWVRSYRWRLLMSPVKQCSIANLYSVNLIGFMANNLMPARLGEFVRAYALARTEQVPASSALGTIVVERVLDGLCLLLVLFAALLFADPGAQAGDFSVAYLRGVGYGLLVLYLGVLAVSLALWRWPQATIGALGRLAGRISPKLGDKAVEILSAFAEGLAILGNARHLPMLMVQTLGVWLPFLGMYWIFLPALGMPASLLMAAMAMGGGSVGSAVPAGPGYIGTFQLAVTWTMMLAGAPQQQALAYSLLLWAAQVLPLTVAGLITMWKKGMDLSALQEKSQELVNK